MRRLRLPSFLTPPALTEEERVRTAALLGVVVWVAVFGAVSSALFFSVLGVLRPGLLPILIAFAVAMLALRRWATRGPIRLASAAVVAGCWVVSSGVVLVDGVPSPALGSYVPIMIMAAALLGARGAAGTALASAGFTLLVGMGQFTSWLDTTPSELNALTWALVTSLQMLMTGALLILITRQRDRAYRRVSDLVEGSPDGIVMLDASGVVRSANAVLGRMVGVESKALRGVRLSDTGFLDPASRKEVVAAASEVMDPNAEQQQQPLSVPVRCRDGTQIWIECNGRCVDLDDGTTGLQVTVRDVTARRRLDEHLQQAQKIESIGRLAGGIAHDFNNILLAIEANADLLRGEWGEPTELREIRDAAGRAASLTRQLLLFSRSETSEPKEVDLAGVVRGLRDLMARLIGEHVKLEVSAPGAAVVLSDRSRLEQVVMNLAVNARDAMPDGGQLTVRVRLDRGPKPRVRLEVEDSGIGMSVETAKNAFEPFYTTKGAGQGTGLGLAVVFGIVTRAGGEITLDSHPGRGTRVVVTFPAVENAATRTPVAAVERPSEGDETILLVEDDRAVRVVAHRMLAGAGYRILEAASPEEARRLSRTEPGPIDLLVSDVIMPQESGPELALHLAGERPEMRVLLISGYTGDALGPHLRSGFDAPLLEKPFTRQDLTERVRALLNAPPKKLQVPTPRRPTTRQVEDPSRPLRLP